MSTENFDTNFIKIVPNPIKNFFEVQDIKVDSIEIYDLEGRKIKEILNSNSIATFELTDGIYFVKILSEGKSSIQKVIK